MAGPVAVRFRGGPVWGEGRVSCTPLDRQQTARSAPCPPRDRLYHVHCFRGHSRECYHVHPTQGTCPCTRAPRPFLVAGSPCTDICAFTRG